MTRKVRNPRSSVAILLTAERRGAACQSRLIECTNAREQRTLLRWLAGERVRLPTGLRAQLEAAGVLVSRGDAPRPIWLTRTEEASWSVDVPPDDTPPVRSPWVWGADIQWGLPWPTHPAAISAPPLDARQMAARRWDEVRRAFATDGVAVMRGLLSPLRVQSLTDWYGRCKEEGRFHDPAPRVPGRRWIHNEPVAQILHKSLASRLSPEGRLVPSFNYVAWYEFGAVLPPHTDREQCAMNLSLSLAHSPPQLTAKTLVIDVNGHEHAVDLEPGDAVIYEGCRRRHWRAEVSQGGSLLVALFAFVGASFSGSRD